MNLSYFSSNKEKAKNNLLFKSITYLSLIVGVTTSLLIFNYVVFEKNYDSFHKKKDNIYRLVNVRHYTSGIDRSAGCVGLLGPSLKEEFPEVLNYTRVFRRGDEVLKFGDEIFTENKVYFVDSTFFDIFSFPLIYGDINTVFNNPYSVVLSESYADKYFKSINPIGKELIVDDMYCQVTGVFKNIPINSHFKPDVLVNFSTLIRRNEDCGCNNLCLECNAYNTYILLEKDADEKMLESKLPTLVKKIHNDNFKREYLLQPISDIHLKSNLRFEHEVNGNFKIVNFLMYVGIFILFLAWINYINLTTAKSIDKAKEIGIKKAFGVQRIMLVKHIVLDTLIKNILVLIVSLILFWLLLPWFNQLLKIEIEAIILRSFKFYLIFLLLFSFGAILSSIYPAFVISAFRPASVLKGKFVNSRKGNSFRKILIISQFIICSVLLFGMLVITKQISFMLNKDLGANIENTLVVKKEIGDFYSFQQSISNYHIIENVSISSTVFGLENSWVSGGIRPVNSDPLDGKQIYSMGIDYTFLDAFEIEILEGRNFSKDFTSDIENSILINESARQKFGFVNNQIAIGEEITFDDDKTVRKIVGVIKDFHNESLKEDVKPTIFHLSPYNGNYITIKFSSDNSKELISFVENEWGKFFKDQPLEFFILQDFFKEQYRSDMTLRTIIDIFSIIAIFISCMGIFGLSYHQVSQKQKDIAVKKVLGARFAVIFMNFITEYLYLIIIVAVIAIPISYKLGVSWLNNYAAKIKVEYWFYTIPLLIILLITFITISGVLTKVKYQKVVDFLKEE